MRRMNLLLCVCIAFAMTFAEASGIAYAQTTSTACDGGIPFVDFDYVSQGRLTVGCASAGVTQPFYALVSSVSCAGSNVPLEILKIWKATADQALLSGKQLIIYWSPCESDASRRIVAISFRR